jgi:signal transduction histidine kinase
MARVDVHAVIARALEVCSPLVSESGLEVVEDLTAEEHHAQGDFARLMQLFWNLIRNASRFTPRGGSVSIRTYNADPCPVGLDFDPGPVDGRELEPRACPDPGGRLLVV